MFIFTARRLSAYPDYRHMAAGHPQKQEHDAFLESFLIHTRVLDEFFRERRKYKTDVIAADVVAGFRLDPDEVPPPLNGLLRTQIDRQLAHATDGRSGKQPFPIRAMVHDMLMVINQFLWRLPDQADGVAVHELRLEVLKLLSDDRIVDVDGS
ncbi:hypothetical protein [Mycobacterium sp. SA01]|uniref:hypothetical protein n=1 Tax=Mycobacterium sp. SA01 TaxID=3238820 RepID=UPI00351BA8D3